MLGVWVYPPPFLPPKRQVSSLDGNSNGTSTTTNTTSSSQEESIEFRATLAWLDPASTGLSAKQLQHDLDLLVTSPGGVTYVMWATSGLRDAANVIERVIVPATEASEEGEWTVTVSSRGFTTDSQAYSLVVTGNFDGGGHAGGDANGVGAGGRGWSSIMFSSAVVLGVVLFEVWGALFTR